MCSYEFAERGPVNFSVNVEQSPGVKYEEKKPKQDGRKAGIDNTGPPKRLEFKMER